MAATWKDSVILLPIGSNHACGIFDNENLEDMHFEDCTRIQCQVYSSYDPPRVRAVLCAGFLSSSESTDKI